MSAALIRCLLAVYALSENFEIIASKDVAQLLGVKRPTVHRSLQVLQERGMTGDYSWAHSANEYVKIYKKLL